MRFCVSDLILRCQAATALRSYIVLGFVLFLQSIDFSGAKLLVLGPPPDAAGQPLTHLCHHSQNEIQLIVQTT